MVIFISKFDIIYLKFHLILMYLKIIDQVRLIVCIFISYPIGIINYYINSSCLRLWYGFLTGIILQYFMYGYGMIIIIKINSIINILI